MTDFNTILEYCKANWDEILLLGFTVIQCILIIVSIFQKRWDTLLLYAPVYFPTLILLIAKMFYGQSWMALTSYVVGTSIAMLVSPGAVTVYGI